MYLAGESTGSIARDFYTKGFKTRSGGKFHSALVRGILRNPIYIGKVVWNRNHYDFKQPTNTRFGFKYVKNDPSKVVTGKGRHEPIVADNIFNMVQARMDANWRGKVHRKNTFDYPLTGLIYCGRCGHKYHGSSSASNHRLKLRKRWYKCSSMGTHHIPCDNPSVKGEDIEPQVFRILKKLFSHKDFLNGRLDNLVKSHMYLNNADVKEELDCLNGALDANLEKQRKINDSYMDNFIGVELYKEKISSLRQEENVLKSDISKCKIQIVERERSEAYLKTLKLAVDNFDETKAKLGIIEKKELLKLIIKSLKVNGGRLVAVVLFEPFQRMYEEVEKRCNTLKNQLVTTRSWAARSACILEPSAGRCPPYRRTMTSLAEALVE